MKTAKFFNGLLVLCLIAVTAANVQPAAAQAHTAPAPGALYVPGEVIVSFASGQTAKATSAQASALAGQISAQVADVEGNLALLSFAEDADVASLAVKISTYAGVQSASPNYIGWIPEANGLQSVTSAPVTSSVVYRTTADGRRIAISKADLRAMRSRTRNIPTYPVESLSADTGDPWGWRQVGADIIWSNATVAPLVCVIDTGVDALNPDLKGKVVNGKDFVNEDLIPNDDNGHGTHVAGIIVASNANKTGLVGVSNGSVLAVKALSSQGWGTTYDLIEAINYCSLNSSVRVINMSLGGYTPSDPLYKALNNAINVKKKFVVVAAGNDSSSDYDFPAAWAAPFVCFDGNPTGDFSDCDTNTIDQGMISVGAGYSLQGTNGWENFDQGGFDGGATNAGAASDSQLWVDINNNGVLNSDENFYAENCLANFSNYGKWVQMIAPGENIYSTLPVSYPYQNLSHMVTTGYGYMSGTSMAAPFVSGAAARVLSVNPTWTIASLAWTPAQLKNKLISDGKPLDASLAVDAGVLPTEITGGYYATDTGTTRSPDPFAASSGFAGEIPYCVPAATGAYTTAQDMSKAVYLDVANAMDRTSVTVYVQDATTGLPLTGATVLAYQGTVLKDQALVSTDTSQVDLVNLPTTYIAPAFTNTIKVTKSGYTTAAIIGVIDPNETYDPLSGVPYPHFQTNEFLNVSIPPTGKITLVADWDPQKLGAQNDARNLDLYTFLPSQLTFTPKIIGNPLMADTFSNAGVDIGSLYTPLAASGMPLFKTRWNLDGGNPAYDGVGVESVSMMPAVGAALNPYHNIIGSTRKYEFFLTDYGAGDANGGMLNYAGGAIVVRLWRGGLPVVGINGDPGPLAGGYPFAYSLQSNCSSALSGVLDVTNGSPIVKGSGTQFTQELVAGSSIFIYDSINEEYNPYAIAAADPFKLTGTVTVADGSATVTGSGTLFSTEVSIDDILYIDGIPYQVLLVNSDSDLTLTEGYIGDGAGLSVTSDNLLRLAVNYSQDSESGTTYLPVVNQWLKIGTIGDGLSSANLSKFYLSDECVIGDPSGLPY